MNLLVVLLASAGSERQRAHNLIIFTCGSMSSTGGDTSRREVSAAFNIKGHSGVMVPVFAYGPGAMTFTRVHDNTKLSHGFIRLLSPDNK